jgi:hypothetical protein
MQRRKEQKIAEKTQRYCSQQAAINTCRLLRSDALLNTSLADCPA